MKQWYVIQLLAGYEERVKAEILKRIAERSMQDLFGEILIPEAKVGHFFAAGEESNEQLFPGYILIQLEPMPETFRLVGKAPRVTRFLGGENPLPLEKNEVERVLAQVRGELPVVARTEEVFELGKEIKIKAGPFSGFSGIIQSVAPERERIVVMVSILGRLTPVELSIDQVKL